MKKNTFTLIEIVFVIILIGVITSFSISKNNINKLVLAKDQIIMHLKYMRYIAMNDNKYEHNNSLWYKKGWNLKFRYCDGKDDIHYYIYSDEDLTGHVKEIETLKDPFTNQYIYSSIHCVDSIDRTNYTLLSKYYNIKKIEISCNETTSIGQVLYLDDGNIYTKFSPDSNVSKNKYKLNEDCTIDLYDKQNNKQTITLDYRTGYVY